jgi:hypothetical protein
MEITLLKGSGNRGEDLGLEEEEVEDFKKEQGLRGPSLGGEMRTRDLWTRGVESSQKIKWKSPSKEAEGEDS